MGDSTGRSLLPQNAQMQSFSFAPPAQPPRETQRNYVFVDEHNRHKRLKVMRACDGCRRRKIKCDSATTNTWPCAACVRLKLKCVPPTLSFESDQGESDKPHEEKTPDANLHHEASQSAMRPVQNSVPPQATMPVSAQYPQPMGLDQLAPYVQRQDSLQYSPVPPTVPQSLHYTPRLYTMEPAPAPAPQLNAPERHVAWTGEDALSMSNISDALGELQITYDAVAPYIANHKKAAPDTPATQEVEVQLPPSATHDHTVRIPPEMMPSEEQALHYFDYYFKNIHPYCPVVHQGHFYQQWISKESISPLMLEAIFACAAFSVGDSRQGSQWLALASNSFKDMPRLSTLQAMVILLKAKEFAPRRGYFWRSWMTVVNMVAMAKDLELHEHHCMHQRGKSCGFAFHECVSRTRAWQTLYVLEIMVGGPQGRFDFGVDVDTLDLDVPAPIAGIDHTECQISRQFTQMVRAAKNVRGTSALVGRLRKVRDDFANDYHFIAHNAVYPRWLRELPDDMQIVYPADDAPPLIPSHYVANMHSYHHLSVIMHLRPQMHVLTDSFDDVRKAHMLTCYAAAKDMCKLQEAVLHTFGLPGLPCMLRGINFTIYAVLTCTMLHLAAITSPDPELSADARHFFVRHMRVLETCTSAWPMAEVQQQVLTLRQAFSADITKPFELKATFPLGSPDMAAPRPSPPDRVDDVGTGAMVSAAASFPSTVARLHAQQQSVSLGPPNATPVDFHAHPITPPISTSGRDSSTSDSSPAQASLMMMSGGQRAAAAAAAQQQQQQQHVSQQQAVGGMMQPPILWNPTKIFDHYNTVFGNLKFAPRVEATSPGYNTSLAPQQQQPPHHQAGGQPSGHIATTPTTAYAASIPYVTPSMWQDVVASSFGDAGLKRPWDYGSATGLIDSDAAVGQAHRRTR